MGIKHNFSLTNSWSNVSVLWLGIKHNCT